MLGEKKESVGTIICDTQK